MLKVAAICLAFGSVVALVPSTYRAKQDELVYKRHEEDKISPAEHRSRRQALLSKLDPKGFTVIFTNPEQQRSNDTDFRFRPNSDFWYLTGCEEPDSALLLVPEGIDVDGQTVREVLFVNDRNPAAETWTGIRMGPAGAKKFLEIEAVVSNTRFLDIVSELKGRPTHPSSQPLSRTNSALAKMNTQLQSVLTSASRLTPVNRLIGPMRMIKSQAELGLLKRAIDATAEAHIEALKSCEPGMREFEIQALVEYIFARNGCEAVAYGSIVGSGVHSCILHYVDNRKRINPGDFLCMDVGGEYHGYAADVTRSYPATGKFSPEQKAIYELVLAAQDAGIAECKVGNAFQAPHRKAYDIIADGLVKLGIIKDRNETRRYFMHGTSHMIGLDVHDPGDGSALAPNMALTVEPGIYIKEGSPCDKKWWNIGVRIEDDILVTSSGPVNLSAKVPRKVVEIEKLMAQKGLGNDKRGMIGVLAQWQAKLGDAENESHESHSHP